MAFVVEDEDECYDTEQAGNWMEGAFFDSSVQLCATLFCLEVLKCQIGFLEVLLGWEGGVVSCLGTFVHFK